MTTLSSPSPSIARDFPPAPPRRPQGARKLWHRSKLYIVLAMLMAPTLVGMAMFTYYPELSAVRYSRYNWDGSGMVEEFRSWANYDEATRVDQLFWPTFSLVLILLAANAIKMWPSIFTAVVLHRVRSERWQYYYRVLFVVPMIIPGIVSLLIWKSFYDPLIGPLNKILTTTGLIHVLRWLDGAMPDLSQRLAPAFDHFTDPLFFSVWGMALTGVLFISAAGGIRAILKGWLWWLMLLIAGFFIMGGTFASLLGGDAAARAAPLGRLALWAGVAIIAAEAGVRFGGQAGRDIVRWAGIALVAAACVLVLGGKTWTEPTKAFGTDTPGWLSQSKLIIPSIILWGFPWVGTVGVLIYLAGLQNISQDIYEAAEIDGVGTVGKFLRIELPLMMTQIRINLIFMTIGTLTDYGLILVLLGPTGGPGNVGMVPGLYMYSAAFVDGRFGYACALGMILFVIILCITILYQKYVKVDK